MQRKKKKTSQYARCSIRKGRHITNISWSMQLWIFANLFYVWFTMKLTNRDENRTCCAAPSLSHCEDLTTHLKLNSGAYLATCRAHIIPYRSDSVSGQSRCVVLLFGCPSCCCYHVKCAVPSLRAQNICENRIANSTFILDTRVACVRFDIFYRDLLLLPVPCGTILNLLRT